MEVILFRDAHIEIDGIKDRQHSFSMFLLRGLLLVLSHESYFTELVAVESDITKEETLVSFWCYSRIQPYCLQYWTALSQIFDEELFPPLGICDPKNPPLLKNLLLLNVFAGHATDTVLSKLRAAKIVTSLIPVGCTRLLQFLDTAINKLFKLYFRELIDQYIDELEVKLGCEVESWSVSNNGIMTTYVVAGVWESLYEEKKDLIEKSFWDVWVTRPVDGSKDSYLKIKGFEVEDLAKEITLDTCVEGLPELLSLRRLPCGQYS